MNVQAAASKKIAWGYVSAFFGATVWTIAAALFRPSPFELLWAKALLALAALVLVPLGFALIEEPDGSWAGRLRRLVLAVQLPAALLLGWSLLVPQGPLAAAMASGYFGMTALAAVWGATRAWRHRRTPLPELCIDAALVYLVVGGAWAVLDRLGSRPLGFDAVIVLLTAIHFHYAGLVLPLTTGLALQHTAGPGTHFAGAAVIVSVPLVAIGITSTQLQFSPLLECAAAWSMAVAGILSAWLHFRIALQREWPWPVRGLWALAAFSLVCGMVLAALYGSRFYLPVSWLDIPWMRAVHGTANAVGIGLAGMIGWAIAKRSSAKAH